MYMIMQAWKVFWNKKVGELCEMLAAHTTGIKLRGSQRLLHHTAILKPGKCHRHNYATAESNDYIGPPMFHTAFRHMR